MNDGIVYENSSDQNYVYDSAGPLDYGKIADFLFQMVEETDGVHKNLYLEKYSDRGSVNAFFQEEGCCLVLASGFTYQIIAD